MDEIDRALRGYRDDGSIQRWLDDVCATIGASPATARTPGERPRRSARRLLWVLLFSLCFTVLAGAVQLFFEYRREMREIEARLELIRSGYLASFERSLWDLNQEQLNVQLRGLGDFPDIARVSLQSADFQPAAGRPASARPAAGQAFP